MSPTLKCFLSSQKLFQFLPLSHIVGGSVAGLVEGVCFGHHSMCAVTRNQGLPCPSKHSFIKCRQLGILVFSESPGAQSLALSWRASRPLWSCRSRWLGRCKQVGQVSGTFLHHHFQAFPFLPQPYASPYGSVLPKGNPSNLPHLKVIISSPLRSSSPQGWHNGDVESHRRTGENSLIVCKSPAQLQWSHKKVRVVLRIGWEKNLLLPGTTLIRFLVS